MGIAEKILRFVKNCLSSELRFLRKIVSYVKIGFLKCEGSQGRLLSVAHEKYAKPLGKPLSFTVR